MIQAVVSTGDLTSADGVREGTRIHKIDINNGIEERKQRRLRRRCCRRFAGRKHLHSRLTIRAMKYIFPQEIYAGTPLTRWTLQHETE